MSRWFYAINDPQDQWLSQDKFAHAFGSAFAYCLGGPWLLIVSAVGIEVIEVIRYRRWAMQGQTGAWPFLTDKVSVKDLVWDVIGGVGAAVLMTLFQLVGFLHWVVR